MAKCDMVRAAAYRLADARARYHGHRLGAFVADEKVLWAAAQAGCRHCPAWVIILRDGDMFGPGLHGACPGPVAEALAAEKCRGCSPSCGPASERKEAPGERG